MYTYFTPRLDMRHTPVNAQCGTSERGESTYNIGDDRVRGWLLCYPFEDDYIIEWSRDEIAVFAWIQSDASPRRAMAFWRLAGPIEPTQGTTPAPTVSPSV